jgi:hypothetical protein
MQGVGYADVLLYFECPTTKQMGCPVNAYDCAGFGFVYKAYPEAHIEMRVGGCNTAVGPKDGQGVELFFFLGPLDKRKYLRNTTREER